ncbi:MAG TPA: signal recognition particle-docking protein FtsY [bacterium]|nr:signal recognition particle-docking protein FtsY [bacterium]HEV2440320.1 signal recognition particle-docking protein FtsY [bacterium]
MARGGWFGRFREGLAKTRQALAAQLDGLLGREVDESFYADLEEALLGADLGVHTTETVVARLRDRARSGELGAAARTAEGLRQALVDVVLATLGDPAPLRLDPPPAGIVVLGVNGAGKTTTIGKLAHRLRADGRRVLVAAADTFRAAAIDQLEVWTERAGVDLVRHAEGSDPAAVVYDAAQAARARHTDVLIVDTAGRLHTKTNLMDELKKLDRVLRRELPGASVESLLVLDATTGQNGIAQARQFAAALPVTGVVLTKLDGTARGGIAVAIADELRLPVKLVGFGEGMDDLQPFDPRAFVEALLEA